MVGDRPPTRAHDADTQLAAQARPPIVGRSPSRRRLAHFVARVHPYRRVWYSAIKTAAISSTPRATI